MSKTFKLSAIFFITVLSLQIARVLFVFINLPDNIYSWLFSGIFQMIFMGLVPFLLYKFWIGDGKYLKDMRINPKIHIATYPLAILVGLVTFFINVFFSSIWYSLLNALGFTYVSGVGTIFSSPLVLVMEILTGALLPAIFEELTDRGLLMAVFDNEKSDAKVIVFIGLFFGFLHQNAPQLGPTAVAGLIIAYLAVKTQSLFPGMIVHFINNFLITIIDYSDQMNGRLNAAYENLYGALTSNAIYMFLSWIAALTLLAVLLVLIAKLNAKRREQKKDARQFFPTAGDAHRIYGDSYARTALPTSTAPVVSKKVVWWEYSLVILAFLAALAGTAMTYFWGLLR